MQSATVSAPQQLVTYDESDFHAHFNRRPFLVQHQLCDHPLFQMSRLVELAQQLPEDQVEYNAGDLPISQDPTKTPRNGLSPEETVRRIEECRSWLVLKNVEHHKEYGELLDQCLAPFERFVPKMTLKECFVFVSSPEAVTPYHIDPEYNFLLQIRGSKTVYMFDANDRDVISEQALEAFHAGASRNLVHDSRFDNRAIVTELTPGYGLHFPITAPHWVKNGQEVSVSFSITFRDPESDRREVLYRINHRLRKIGIRPKPVGTSAFSDGVKFAGFSAARSLKKLISR